MDIEVESINLVNDFSKRKYRSKGQRYDALQQMIMGLLKKQEDFIGRQHEDRALQLQSTLKTISLICTANSQ